MLSTPKEEKPFLEPLGVDPNPFPLYMRRITGEGIERYQTWIPCTEDQEQEYRETSEETHSGSF